MMLWYTSNITGYYDLDFESLGEKFSAFKLNHVAACHAIQYIKYSYEKLITNIQLRINLKNFYGLRGLKVVISKTRLRQATITSMVLCASGSSSNRNSSGCLEQLWWQCLTLANPLVESMHNSVDLGTPGGEEWREWPQCQHQVSGRPTPTHRWPSPSPAMKINTISFIGFIKYWQPCPRLWYLQCI